MRFLFLPLLLAGLAAAQTGLSPAEESDLQQALAEAGNSSIEFARAVEAHLNKYPQSPQREELERAAAKAAIENKDRERLITYGEKVLAREPDDVEFLEKVARALLTGDDKVRAARALKYAGKLEETLRPMDPPRDRRNRWQIRQDLDERLGKALVYRARASGNLGNLEDAVALARKSYDTCPTAESAREIARWLARQEKWDEAVDRYADAFTIQDGKATEAERVADRAKLGEAWAKSHPDQTGLGDRVLAAFDRTRAAIDKHRARLREYDLNALLTDPMEFTLAGLKDQKLPLASLRGKVVVMDFWATWCGPCRAQHPLYEQVKKKFTGRDDVVFLAVSTDEDPAVVEPFLEKQKWTKSVYFESGLSRLMRVSSIPTTVIVNKRGEIASRMNGFVPERFVEMLTARIQQILEE